MAKQAKFDLGYDLQENGDQRIVRFRGDGLPWSAWIVFPLVFLGISVLFTTAFWFVPVLVIGGLGYLIWLTVQPQELILTPSAIIKGGTEYQLDRVSEVLIDNPMDKGVSITAQPGLIVGGTGIAGASMATMSVLSGVASNAMVGAAAANARAAAKRRFRVRIRYGAKLVTLARNLKEDRAVSIFSLLTAE